MVYFEIPTNIFLEELATTLSLGASFVSWRPTPEVLYIVGVQVS
jgi:hypothetical protein